MPTTEPSSLISPSLIDAVSTNVDLHVSSEVTNRDAWQRLIDYKLIDWGCNTEDFDDEGIEPPSRDTIQCAIALAKALRDKELAAPDSIVPDANGGIVFERRERDMSEVFHIWDDGTIEYRRFQGTRLIERRPL